MGNELEKMNEAMTIPRPMVPTNVVADRSPVKRSTSSLPFGLMSFDEFQRMCEALYKSGATPCKRWEEVMAYAIAGHERGLSIFQAFANLQLTNGRFTVWGDGIGALLLGSGLCEKFERWVEGEGDKMKGICVVKRKGDAKEHREEFTYADAKKAGYLDKKGPWQTHTKRMFMWRASGFAAREKFPDVLLGLVTSDEWDDIRDANGDSSGVTPPPSTTLQAQALSTTITTIPPKVVPPVAVQYPDSVGGIDTSMHPPKMSTSPPPITPRESIVNRLGPLREAWLKKLKIDPANREAASKAWADLLGGKWNAKSIKDMSDSQCEELLALLSDETASAEIKDVFG